jgi:acetoin utilization protein AcuB
MRHPKRAVTRDIRTRRPIHPARAGDELEAETWPETMRVADRMTRGVAVVHSDALVRGAAEMMRSRKIRHLPVVDRDGHLVGIVTDRDLRQVIFDPVVQERAGELATALQQLRVRDIMTWAVITTRPGTHIREAARIMYEQKIGALPVVDGDRLVGILTERDVLGAFADVLGEGTASRPYRWAFAYR